MVGCGNFEDTEGLRTDSPTADVEAHNLVFSFCAAKKVKVRVGDVQNSYLQGQEVDRIILYRIPKGGIPECGIAEGTVVAVRVLIYGTKDAGRGFWLKLKDVVTKAGFKLNQIITSLFALTNSAGEIVAMLSSNVDDVLYGFLPEAQEAITAIFDAFKFGTEGIDEFRFCGKEVKQDADFNITVTAKDNTEKIKPIVYDDAKKLTQLCNETEITQIRSVIAALAWVARQVRPALSFRVSRMQSLVNKATVKELRETNRILEYAIESSEIGIYFSSSAFSWDDAVVATIGDASFGNEKLWIDKGADIGFEEDHSQQGYIVALGPPDMINAKTSMIHPIAWSSTVIKRACRATLMAETFAMLTGTEHGARIRAGIVDCRGKLDMKNWEVSAAANMSHIWFTDCDSLYEHLVSPSNKQVANKRLAIDLKSLRQRIWERDGDRTEVVDHTSGDYPRWIDTSTMLADPLTKVMSSERLDGTMMTGLFDMRPTAEILAIKARNRQARQANKDEDKD